MKIAVLSTFVPFHRGGAEILADAVTERLAAAGHEARQFRLPVAWEPAARILDSYLAFRMLDLSAYDRVVAFKFPAYCVSHPGKVVWLFHQFRQAYDLWGTPYQGLPSDESGMSIRRAVIAADERHLLTCPRIYCNSEVTAERLKKYNDREAEVLYAPLVNAGQFHAAEYGDYIFCPSRMSLGKRQMLLVQALARTTSPVRLVLAGQPDQPQVLQSLGRAIESLGLEHRVEIEPAFISEQRKADLMSRALAVAYIPYDEDSYGYVTLEAYQARRPVLTCSDSGGILKLVAHRESGYVADPDPDSLAAGIDYFASHREALSTLAAEGMRRADALGISWTRVMDRLLNGEGVQ